jgi:hypothetical protein
MKTTFQLLAALLASTTLANASWEFEKSVDEMTDEVSYLLHTEGDTVRLTEVLAYNPVLCVRITPKIADPATRKMTGKLDCYVAFEYDGISRNGGTALVRFDNAPAVEWGFNASTDRRSAFLEKPGQAIGKLRTSSKLKVRLETTLGAIRLFAFDTAAFSNKFEEVRSLILSERPKGVKFGPIPATGKRTK